MELLLFELINLVCQWLSLRDISYLSLTSKYLNTIVQSDKFFLFCKTALLVDKSRYWLILMQNFDYFTRFYEYRLMSNPNEIFQWACGKGPLEVAMWLRDRYEQIDIQSDNEFAFKFVCVNLDIWKLLSGFSRSAHKLIFVEIII